VKMCRLAILVCVIYLSVVSVWTLPVKKKVGAKHGKLILKNRKITFIWLRILLMNVMQCWSRSP